MFYNPFEILGLTPTATRDEVDVRYNELRQKYQADRFLPGEAGEEASENTTLPLIIVGMATATDASNASTSMIQRAPGMANAKRHITARPPHTPEIATIFAFMLSATAHALHAVATHVAHHAVQAMATCATAVTCAHLWATCCVAGVCAHLVGADGVGCQNFVQLFQTLLVTQV